MGGGERSGRNWGVGACKYDQNTLDEILKELMKPLFIFF